MYVAQAKHNTHKRQTSVPPVGFEPTISGTAFRTVDVTGYLLLVVVEKGG
jgi:hypothetical protein